MQKILQAIQTLFTAERIPLAGGGVLELGVSNDKFAQTLLRLQNMLLGSRGLNRLVDRAKPDVDWLMAAMGYDLDFAQQMASNEYHLFRDEALAKALMIALLNDNFIASSSPDDGMVIALKPSVVYPNLVIPASYWDHTDLNAERALEGVIPLPNKAKANPAEQKLGLIYALQAHEKANHRDGMVYVRVDQAPVFDRENNQIGEVHFGTSLPTLKWDRLNGADVFELEHGGFIAVEQVVITAFDRVQAQFIRLLSSAGAFRKGGQPAPQTVVPFPRTHANPAPSRPRKRGKRGGQRKK